MNEAAVQRALDVKRRHEKTLRGKANVVAVGVGRRVRGGVPSDEVCIVVSVKVKLPAARLAPSDVIPGSLEGVPVDVVATGEISALS